MLKQCHSEDEARGISTKIPRPFRALDFGDDLIPILFIIAIILFGYHEIFLGANFFTFKDPIGMSDATYYTPLNGWRPDIRFGISFFFG
ncbi:MAG: hypothetical protein AAB309_01910, partial [Deltaproteobacteria bacterium]